MSKTKVKAGRISNLTDARYFAARGVEWLGFRIGTGRESVSLAEAKAMAAWVDGVNLVAEFSFATPAEILEWSAQAGIGTVQVGTFAEIEDLRALKHLSVIKEVVAGPDLPPSSLTNHLNAFRDCCDFFLLDFSPGGYYWQDVKNGHPFHAAFLGEICSQYNIILHLDCAASVLTEMLEEIQPQGLQLYGGGEEKVGLKSFDELDEIFDILEME